MSTLFNEQIAYWNGTQDTDSDTTFSSTDTYTDLIMNIDNAFGTDTTISYSNADNEIKANSIGIYLVQSRLSVSGGANAEYTMQMTLDDVSIDYSEMTFTTKGSNLWEVQNLFLVELNLNPAGRSVRKLKNEIKCTTGTNTLTLKNASFVLIRIQ
tara:strand:- start:336 stop:800 length:465 start_codon:yes stop_codon:yes gene_type:complete